MNRPRRGDDRGSTIPLILGFFLIALLLVAGAVLASDAFTQQRELQSVCDGAVLAAANALDTAAARTQTLTGSLPLAAVQQASDDYLAEDPTRSAVSVQTGLSADGRTVLGACSTRNKLAFGAVIGRSDGIEQHATSSARAVLG